MALAAVDGLRRAAGVGVVSETLFEGYGAIAAEPVEKVSADRRRTLHQRALVEAGVHPLTGDKARPDLGTCGDCKLRLLVHWRNRTYAKCARGLPEGAPLDEAPFVSHGAATDVRAWWPACPAHELGDPTVGPDAMRVRP